MHSGDPWVGMLASLGLASWDLRLSAQPRGLLPCAQPCIDGSVVHATSF